MDLFDLIVYDREEGDLVAKYSAEHLTRFSLMDGFLIIESSQVNGVNKYRADKIGFYFQGR